MTNRDKILNTNIYDLLISMNTLVIQSSYYENCILEVLEHNHVECKEDSCEECIQNYLNKEI